MARQALGFTGDYDTWYAVGPAIAVRAKLARDPEKDIARLEWEPFSSMDDEYLDERASGVRAVVTNAREWATEKRSEKMLARIAGWLGWVAFASVSDAMKSRVTKADADAAWRAGLDALRTQLR